MLLLSFVGNIIIVLAVVDADTATNAMVVFDVIGVVTIDFIMSLLILNCVFLLLFLSGCWCCCF